MEEMRDFNIAIHKAIENQIFRGDFWFCAGKTRVTIYLDAA
jgi:hypothetical protein